MGNTKYVYPYQIVCMMPWEKTRSSFVSKLYTKMNTEKVSMWYFTLIVTEAAENDAKKKEKKQAEKANGFEE